MELQSLNLVCDEIGQLHSDYFKNNLKVQKVSGYFYNYLYIIITLQLESLVREMQDSEHGVPVRDQKGFITSIPAAFMGEAYLLFNNVLNNERDICCVWEVEVDNIIIYNTQYNILYMQYWILLGF